MTIFALFHPALDDVASPAGGFLADRTTKPVTAQDVLRRYRQYRAVFPRTGITVAAQALRLPAVAEAVKKRGGHSVDARSCEELVLALATGIPAQRIVMHDDGDHRRTDPACGQRRRRTPRPDVLPTGGRSGGVRRSTPRG